ncbi:MULTISPECIES: PilX N-terminal domain-containing pilus assembly protein [unclassified Thiocapsa]|uniref:PilX N-terminal domain-containing pilus assembly protein n=1 Tax=unclassified Thiocapsa TaxID=2641286 RepID=UPI0035B173DB
MQQFVQLYQHDNQRGAVLVIALIMLLLTTLIVVASFQMGTSNLLVVSNLESRQQTQKAAEATLEFAVDARYINILIDSVAPGSTTAPFYCKGQKNHKCFDLDGDGSDDLEVDLTTQPPRCIGTTGLLNNQLTTEPDDQGCFLGTLQIGAVEGSDSKGYSLCSTADWDLVARAVDLATGSETRVRQGVGRRVSNNDIPPECQ